MHYNPQNISSGVRKLLQNNQLRSFISMPALIASLIFIISGLKTSSYCQTDLQLPKDKVLLIYDKTDEKTKIYIDTYRKYVFDAGMTLTEVKLDKGNVPDVSEFKYVLVYSKVMAFNMMSPVRKWLKSVKGIENRNFFILVTATNIFYKENLEDLTSAVKKNKGIIVDATSSATSKLSSEQKVSLVNKHLEKMK